MSTQAESTSTPVPKVYDAIVRVMHELSIEGISKSRANQQQKYLFRGIDDVLNALSPILSENKLCVLPRVLSRSVVERETRNGGALFYTVLDVEFDFVSAEDGSRHTVRTVGEAMDSGDKSSNKAMSAAYKYACIQAFCIPTEGDNDTDATTHEVATNQPRQREANANTPPPPKAGPSEAEINTLMRTLVAAAKLGSQALEQTWKSNPGPVRLAIFNDATRMETLKRYKEQADRGQPPGQEAAE